MIVQIKGNVKFPITLDPSVWIFDDRKIRLEDAFANKTSENVESEETDAKKMAEMFEKDVQSGVIPPGKQPVKRIDKEKVLSESYVMPLKPFLKSAEINEGAKSARLIADDEEIIISIEQLMDSLARFSDSGKPLKDDGPIHIYFGDGSNREQPFKGIKQIIIE
ncbi:MAG: hypothetical protein GX374_02460 [Bacilli bacterium]|nr:hypothetical protein [Bacilli bacterium]